MRRGSRPRRGEEQLSREWGQLLEVSPVDVGADVTVAAAAGAVSVVVDVDEGEIFEDESGALLIGAQVVDFTGYDPDTGTLALAEPLDAAVAEDDTVYLYDRTRADVVSDLEAEVDVEEWDGEPLSGVLLADGLEDSLPVGARDPGDGEEVLVEYDPDEDEWTIIRTKGLGRVRGIKFETHDAHTLTSANVTAGTVTFPLSHRPSDEAVEGYWEGIRQGPGEFTVDYDAPAVTWPLSGFEAAGDVLGVHYAYRAGIVTPETPLTADSLVGTSSAYLIPETSLLVPVNSQVGDLFVIAVAPNGTCTDPRIEGTWKHALAPAVVAYWGHLDTLDPFTILSSHGSNWGAAAMVAYRGVDVKEGWGQPVTTPGEAKEMGPSAGVAVVALWSSGTVAASTAIDSTGAYTRRAWKNEGTEGVSIFDWFPSGGTVEPNPVGSFATDGTPNFLALVTLRLKVAR